MTAPQAREGQAPAPININLTGHVRNARDRARILAILEKELKPVNVVHPAVKATPAKTGYKTTEFWITVLTAVGATAASATDNLPPRYAALASTLSVIAYAVSRGLAKR